MPAKSEKQRRFMGAELERKRRFMGAELERKRRFMGAELERKREGKKTRTGMSEEQLEDFASKPTTKKKGQVALAAAARAAVTRPEQWSLGPSSGHSARTEAWWRAPMIGP